MRYSPAVFLGSSSQNASYLGNLTSGDVASLCRESETIKRLKSEINTISQNDPTLSLFYAGESVPRATTGFSARTWRVLAFHQAESIIRLREWLPD